MADGGASHGLLQLRMVPTTITAITAITANATNTARPDLPSRLVLDLLSIWLLAAAGTHPTWARRLGPRHVGRAEQARHEWLPQRSCLGSEQLVRRERRYGPLRGVAAATRSDHLNVSWRASYRCALFVRHA